MLEQLSSLSIKAPVVWLCKGFEQPQVGGNSQHAHSKSTLASTTSIAPSQGLLAHEILQIVAPNLVAGVLSGPSFAQEVAGYKPTALVAASEHASVRRLLVDAFHTDKLRIYSSDDVIGVEVGGAVKNVLAIATGLCDGLELGLNARAALITRGLSEMTALGIALGAKAHTFMGLSGLGDLVLTTTGDLSRNRKVGLCLAKGMSLNETLTSLGHVAEGVYSAKTVTERARLENVEMPIADAVVALLEGRLKISQVVTHLMGRSAKEEASALEARTKGSEAW
jgi:glycerol-3-phosphate dehydrogenase (NAD(P)+)